MLLRVRCQSTLVWLNTNLCFKTWFLLNQPDLSKTAAIRSSLNSAFTFFHQLLYWFLSFISLCTVAYDFAHLICSLPFLLWKILSLMVTAFSLPNEYVVLSI